MESWKYEELSFSEKEESLKQTSLVYVPIGSLEFHGPHLPLGLDTIHSYEFCTRLAGETGGLVLPPTYWGTDGHVGWSGSLLISKRTFRALLKDIFTLLSGNNVKLIVTVTGHYPEKQGVIIKQLAREAMKKRPGTKILSLDPLTYHPGGDHQGDHGGKVETSLMLAIRPDLVHIEKLAGQDALKGIMPNAAEGNKEFGKEWFDSTLQNCVRIIKEELKKII